MPAPMRDYQPTTISLQASCIVVCDPASRIQQKIALTDKTPDQLRSWQKRYQERPPNRQQQHDHLLHLGQDLFHWLDQQHGLSDIISGRIGSVWHVEFQLPGMPATDLERRFIDLPWECLANQGEFLAGKLGLEYNPIRRIGERKAASPPAEHRLSVMFMAASPEGGGALLDYEQEELALLEATGGIDRSRLDLFVEDSGHLNWLAEELQRLRGVDVLHLSCHGTADGQTLLLEDEYGLPQTVTLHEVYQAIRHPKPQLLVLSACHTAETAASPQSKEDQHNHHLALGCLQAGTPAVIGMGGAVSDAEATTFSATLYAALSRQDSLQGAMAAARFSALNPGQNNPLARDWHLPRLLLSATGGGVLCNGYNSRYPVSGNSSEKEMLGGKPVAGRKAFVGRRRQTQEVLRVWRQEGKPVIITGMGRQGKSSLALRLATRLQQHRMLAIRDNYSPAFILQQLKDKLNHPVVSVEVNKAEQLLQQDSGNLQPFADCLQAILEQVFYRAGGGQRSLLLVIDDLEQILEPSNNPHQPYHRFRNQQAQQTILKLIRVFAQHSGDACLLFTSRERFHLSHNGVDQWQQLHVLPLPPMPEAESRKQFNQQHQPEQKQTARLTGDGLWSIAQRGIALSKGSPGLQDTLFRLIYADPENAEQLLQQLDDYYQRAQEPDTPALRAFFEDLALDALLGLLTPAQHSLLQALRLFEIPVPFAVIQQFSATLGCEEADWERLLALGLCDEYTQGAEQREYMLHPLVLPKVEVLNASVQIMLIPGVLDVLQQHWVRPINAERQLQLLQLAIPVEHFALVAECCQSGLYYLYQTRQSIGQAQQLALKIALWVLDNKLEPDSQALRWVAEILIATDYPREQVTQLYERALQQAKSEQLDQYDTGAIKRSYAMLLKQLGDINSALLLLEDVSQNLKAEEHLHAHAVTLGDIARIRVSKGEVDAALALHQEEIKVYEALGDQRSRAVTLGDIARIRVDKGEVDAALALHQERLQVFEALGDQRSRAVTLGDIARIRVDKGEVDAALALHQERLQVFEALGDQRSRAVTLGDIARIRVDKGEVDAALALHQERLQVFEALGDQRSRAVTLGDIARIRVDKGEVDAALALHQEEIKVYEALGDQRLRAVTLGDIARIRVSKGEVAEAIALQQDRLAVARHMGDLDSIAGTQWDLSQIYLQREDYQSLLESLTEAWQILSHTGRVDGLMAVGNLYGQLLMAVAQAEAALPVLQATQQAMLKLGQGEAAQQVAALIQQCEAQLSGEGDS